VESNRVPVSTDTKLKRIAWLSAREPEKKYDQLMHHFNEGSLAACFQELDGKKALGIDGITKVCYGENLDDNLKDLVVRMKRMAYKPAPVRQVLIPKEGKRGATRPLGIGNFEDKLVQKMMQKILGSIYEPRFLDCSFGFRPGRGCHDAIRALHHHLYRHEVQTVLDVDLANFFGTIDHSLLLDVLKEKIGDQRLLRYLTRMFKAGVLADGELTVSEEGVPQGSVCSPVLANVIAHYVIDDWFYTVVKAHCAGRVEMFRYCDDLVVCCQYEQDARRINKALKSRLEKFNLQLNVEKTKLVSFDKRAYFSDSKPQIFDFLGLTFYWGRSRNGAVIPKVKTMGKRQRSKLKKINLWGREVRNKFPLPVIWRIFGQKLDGHIRYYGVSHNLVAVQKFRHHAVRLLFKHLNRRSQRKSCNWEQFKRYEKTHPLPKARICHALF
jgi:RNA-directed DNA polymerase